MFDVNAFIKKYAGITEEYSFYDGTVKLVFDTEIHAYFLVKDLELIPVDGVTTVCHIIDKSPALVPWAAKMVAEQILEDVPLCKVRRDDAIRLHVAPIPYGDFCNLVYNAKSAPNEKKEEAGDIGHLAHAMIEQYIKEKLGEPVNPIINNLDEEDTLKAINCYNAALDWMVKHNVRWHCTERKVYSKKYQYAGTLDGIAWVDSCDDKLCCPNPFKDRKSLVDWKSSNYLYIEFLLQTAAYKFAYQEEVSAGVPILDDRWIIRLGKDDGEFEPWHMEEGYADDLEGFIHALKLSRSVSSLKDRMKINKRARAEAHKQHKKFLKQQLTAAEKVAKAEAKARVKSEREAKKKLQAAENKRKKKLDKSPEV